MSIVPELFVGIDFHQKFSTVCVMNKKGDVLFEQNCDSSAEFINNFVRWEMSAFKEVRLQGAVEACGGSSKLAEDLRQLGWKTELAHASTVARLKKNRDKTDKQDARTLADLMRVGYLPGVYLAPERQRQLRSVVRHRQNLAHNRSQIKLRIRGLMREAHLQITSARAWTKAWILELKRRIRELGEERYWICEDLLEDLIYLAKRITRTEKRLKEAVAKAPGNERLLEQPGIGPVTAGVILAEIGDFSRFRNGKQLSRYCGLAPINNSSGERDQQTGIGKACNGGLRRVLIEASHRLSRHEPRWGAMKRHLLSEGKKRAVAAVAVANRWLRTLHYQMTREIPSQETAA